MKSKEFDRHLKVLKDEERHYLQKNWEESARFFFEAAAAGTDIGAALPALHAVYIEAMQIGVLRAAAAAIAAHDLLAKDVAHLRELLRKARFKDYVFEGIADAASKQIDLAPVIDLLIEHLGEREHYIIELLLRHAGNRGFLEAARAISRTNPAHLHEFIKEAQAKKFPIEPALPELAAQLSNAKRAARIASTFRWMVELGADFSGIVAELGKHIDSTNEDVAFEMAYCLSYHHAAKGAWKELDPLLAVTHPKARFGAGRALRVRLLAGGHDEPEAIDRIAAGLLSDDATTRTHALSALKEAKHKGRRVAPSKSVAARLAASVTDPIAEYLHLALPPDEILRLLPTEGTLAAERLRADCVAPVKACPICIRLPRSGSWSCASDLPPELNKLTASDGLSRCPGCGRYYGQTYEDEWDDMSHSETWSLTRYTPPEVLNVAKGAALEEFRRIYDAWIAGLRRELRHPELVVRVEAAVDIAAHLISCNEWTDLRDLMTSSEDPVRAKVIELLHKSGAAPAGILETLRRFLDSPDSTVRSRAADLLASRFVQKNDVAELQRLLASGDDDVLVSAVQAISRGSRESFDASPLFDRLATLRAHKRESIRTSALWALSSLDLEKGAPDPLPLFIEDLSSPVADWRNSAAFQIKELAAKRPDAATAIPKLAGLLRDKESSYWALSALQSFSAHGADMDPVVPVLVECAVAPDSDRRDDVIYFLQALAKKSNLQPHLAALSGLLNSTESARSAVRQLLENHFENRGDLAPAADGLRGMLDDSEAYLRESAANLLARWHARTKNMEGLRELLHHPRSESLYMTIDVVRETRFDLAPLLPDLVASAGHPKSIVRDRVSSALVEFAKSTPAAREAVVAALGTSKACKAIRTLIDKADS